MTWDDWGAIKHFICPPWFITRSSLALFVFEKTEHEKRLEKITDYMSLCALLSCHTFNLIVYVIAVLRKTLLRTLRRNLHDASVALVYVHYSMSNCRRATQELIYLENKQNYLQKREKMAEFACVNIHTRACFPFKPEWFAAIVTCSLYPGWPKLFNPGAFSTNVAQQMFNLLSSHSGRVANRRTCNSWNLIRTGVASAGGNALTLAPARTAGRPAYRTFFY